MKIRVWFSSSIFSTDLIIKDEKYEYYWRPEFASQLNQGSVEDTHIGSPIEILEEGDAYAWIDVSDAVWAAICAKILES